jgi:catechol 2,3-dioxygenase-like lactoylglutathione lyase family enzyme
MTMITIKPGARGTGDAFSQKRRLLLGVGAGFGIAALSPPMGRARAQAAAADASLVARQLPLKDPVGLEHIGTVVPDVMAAARFFGRVFNPVVYKEREPPLRYYVTLDPGYIALGSREGSTGAFIDHDCVMAEYYDRAAMAQRLEQEKLPPGRFGIIKDPDDLGLQLLPIGGLAASTVPAGRIVDAAPLVRPRGLYRVLRYVAEIGTAVDFYRRFFGQEIASPLWEGVWFAVGPTFFGLQQTPPGATARIDRFCVNVAAGDFDVGSVAQALVALGATVLSEPGEEFLYFRSPEGIGVELRPVDPARMWGRT